MAEEPIIVFENVTKEYTLYKNDADRFKALFFKPRNAKKHLALKDVSLKINQGESIGIIGDNGAGKSTATPLRLELTMSWLSAPSRFSCNWYGISPDTGSG